MLGWSFTYALRNPNVQKRARNEPKTQVHPWMLSSGGFLVSSAVVALFVGGMAVDDLSARLNKSVFLSSIVYIFFS